MLLFSMSTTNQIAEINARTLENYIVQIANGNKSALEKLYNETAKSIFGFSFSILKNFHDAQDVLQDVFIKVWNNAYSYEPRFKPMAWLLTITKNLSLSKLRANSKFIDFENFDLENSILNSFDTDIEDKIIIKALLKSVSDIERQIIVLHALSGLKYREISKLLDIPLSTVISKYNRAIKKLKLIEEVD